MAVSWAASELLSPVTNTEGVEAGPGPVLAEAEATQSCHGGDTVTWAEYRGEFKEVP